MALLALPWTQKTRQALGPGEPLSGAPHTHYSGELAPSQQKQVCTKRRPLVHRTEHSNPQCSPVQRRKQVSRFGFESCLTRTQISSFLLDPLLFAPDIRKVCFSSLIYVKYMQAISLHV